MTFSNPTRKDIPEALYFDRDPDRDPPGAWTLDQMDPGAFPPEYETFGGFETLFDDSVADGLCEAVELARDVHAPAGVRELSEDLLTNIPTQSSPETTKRTRDRATERAPASVSRSVRVRKSVKSSKSRSRPRAASGDTQFCSSCRQHLDKATQFESGKKTCKSCLRYHKAHGRRRRRDHQDVDFTESRPKMTSSRRRATTS